MKTVFKIAECSFSYANLEIIIENITIFSEKCLPCPQFRLLLHPKKQKQ